MRQRTDSLFKPSKIITVLSGVVSISFGQVVLTTAQIVKRVSPSVVVIQGKTNSGSILGSGFVISKDGKIITNLHIIRDLQTVSVHLANGRTLDSISILATDERLDLAIIGISGFGPTKTYRDSLDQLLDELPDRRQVLDLGNSDNVSVGEPLVIIGSPRGLEQTVTAGILSSVRDSGDGLKLLQTDAAVNPGNSGGPLLNKKGQAIGVVSFKLRSSEGLNFAIPINYVRGLLSNLHAPMTLGQMRKSISSSSPAQDNHSVGPSLKETLGWLKDKLPLGVVNSVSILNGVTHFDSQQLTVESFDSCTVVFGQVVVRNFKEHPESGPLIMTIRNTVSLAALTAGVVVPFKHVDDTKETFVSGDRWAYHVPLTSNAKEIYRVISFNNPAMPPSTSSANEVNLNFNDEAMAKRILEAFNHAADLCRKKDVF